MANREIRPSKLARVIICPASVAACRGVEEPTAGPDADRGTRLHSVAQIAVQIATGDGLTVESAVHDAVERLQYGPLPPDDVRAVVMAVDYALGLPVADFRTEARLDFWPFVADFEGQADFIGYEPGTGEPGASEGTLHVLDYKFGFRPVKANSPQLLAYGLGAVNGSPFSNYNFDRVVLHVVQPAVGVDTFETAPVPLMLWWEQTAKPAIDSARAPDAAFGPSEECLYCPRSGNCKAQSDELSRVLAGATHPETITAASCIDPEKLAEVVLRKKEIEKWLEAAERFAISQAVRGVKIPGAKLVASITRSKIADDNACGEELAGALRADGADPDEIDEILYTTSLRSISELRTALPKSALVILNKHVVKPDGAPTLAPVTDRRPEISASAEDLFSEE